MRVEHWTNAVDRPRWSRTTSSTPGTCGAHNPVEYVWSDQYDWKVQIVGRPARATEHRLIGELTGRIGPGGGALHGRDGRLCGAVTVNWPKALVTCRRLMLAGTTFDDALAQVSALAPRAVAS